MPLLKLYYLFFFFLDLVTHYEQPHSLWNQLFYSLNKIKTAWEVLLPSKSNSMGRCRNFWKPKVFGKSPANHVTAPCRSELSVLGTKAIFHSPLGWGTERMASLGRDLCRQQHRGSEGSPNRGYGEQWALLGGWTLKSGYSWMFKVKDDGRVKVKVQQLPSVAGEWIHPQKWFKHPSVRIWWS